MLDIMRAETNRDNNTIDSRVILEVVDDPTPANGPEVPRSLTARHALNVRHHYVWCSTCGSYTTGVRIRKLKGDCDGEPSSGHVATRRDRLERGLDPRTRAPLPGETRKLCVTDLVRYRNAAGAALLTGAGEPVGATLPECVEKSDHG